MRSLILEEGDGRLFERIYELAAQLADPKKAKELSEHSAGERFWQGAFNDMGGDDKLLTSAILQTLSVPFGAYVLTEKSPDRLEITPWLLSGENIIAEKVKKLTGADVDAEALYSASRSFSLTADFLTWLEKRSNIVKRG